MRFINKGLIFDISSFAPFKDYEFAQSPQVFPIENGFRIFFSSRRKYSDGRMPISEVLYVDFNREFTQITSYSRGPILTNPILGSFDEHGVFPFHVKEVNSRIFAYLSGWSRRISVPVETAIGIAESFDGGKTFERLGDGPIMAASTNEPFLVGDPFVVQNKQGFQMFYIAGTEWKYYPGARDPQRIYKIRTAGSVDGINWRKSNGNLITDKLGSDECQALPTVIQIGDTHFMIFCFREASGFRNIPERAYRLGGALSSNMEQWDRDDSLIKVTSHESGWDSNMKCYPNATVIDSKVVLLYNGNSFGKHGFGMATCDLEELYL